MIKWILLVIIGVGLGYFAVQYFQEDAQDAADALTGASSINTALSAEQQLAVSAAKEAWRKAVLEGKDLSSGPCLSNAIIPNWVADIAHNPRQDVDNLAENQCSAFRNGEAAHFVELDPNGELIRAL